MEVLIRNGVDLLQGYYIGMPILEIKDIDKNVKDDIININKEIKD